MLVIRSSQLKAFLIYFVLFVSFCFVSSKLIEGLVMKSCHDNNGAAIYVGRAATVHNPLFLFTLQLNIFTETFLLISCPNTFQNLLCLRLHNDCILLTMVWFSNVLLYLQGFVSIPNEIFILTFSIFFQLPLAR